MPRAFVAIELDAPVRDALLDCCATLRDAEPAWAGEKWVAAENLHVTLRFLGDVPDASLPLLCERIGDAAAGVGPFGLTAEHISAVPSPHTARMLWCGFDDPSGSAGDLAHAVGAACAGFTAADDPKPFRAHATLVRARRPRRICAEALADAESLLSALSPSMSVRHVTLLASTLTRHGPLYRAIGRQPLRSA